MLFCFTSSHEATELDNFPRFSYWAFLFFIEMVISLEQSSLLGIICIFQAMELQSEKP